MAEMGGLSALSGDPGAMSMASKRKRLNSRLSNLTDGGSFLDNSGDFDPTRPRKPLSAFIFFSQEFKAILKQKFTHIFPQTLKFAVKLKWQSLIADEKTPFEQLSANDKSRYSKENEEFKKEGKFNSGANVSQKIQNTNSLPVELQ